MKPTLDRLRCRLIALLGWIIHHRLTISCGTVNIDTLVTTPGIVFVLASAWLDQQGPLSLVSISIIIQSGRSSVDRKDICKNMATCALIGWGLWRRRWRWRRYLRRISTMRPGDLISADGCGWAQLHLRSPIRWALPAEPRRLVPACLVWRRSAMLLKSTTGFAYWPLFWSCIAVMAPMCEKAYRCAIGAEVQYVWNRHRRAYSDWQQPKWT